MDERDRLRFELGLLATGRGFDTDMQSENLDPRDVNERYQLWSSRRRSASWSVCCLERRREFEGYLPDPIKRAAIRPRRSPRSSVP